MSTVEGKFTCLVVRKVHSMPVRYWIGVASKDHVKVGIREGIAQVCHGKDKPLRRMKKDDWIVYYSHIEKLGGREQVQAFTAIGKILDDKVYQYEMSPGFVPFRRNVRFVEEFEEVLIKPLIYELNFIEDKQFWGQKFKYGHFEISKKDFFLIARKMKILRRKMTAKEVMENYLKDFNEGKISELSKYFAEDAQMNDNFGKPLNGKAEIVEFYSKPMPPATMENESVEEVSANECIINADFISDVMGNSKVEEKVKINSEGKIISLEMKVTK